MTHRKIEIGFMVADGGCRLDYRTKAAKRLIRSLNERNATPEWFEMNPAFCYLRFKDIQFLLTPNPGCEN